MVNIIKDTNDILEYVEQKAKISIRCLGSRDKAEFSFRNYALTYHKEHNLFVIHYYEEFPDQVYGLAQEAVRILRAKQALKKDTLFPYASKVGVKKACLQLKKDYKALKIPHSQRALAFRHDYFTLMHLLGTIPGNCWITTWIYKKSPALKKASMMILEYLYSEKILGFSFSDEKRIPKKIFKATMSIKAAYALFLDRLLKQDKYFVPFKTTPYASIARTLVALNDKDRGVKGDIEVAKKWAAVLGVKGWFLWG